MTIARGKVVAESHDHVESAGSERRADEHQAAWYHVECHAFKTHAGGAKVIDTQVVQTIVAQLKEAHGTVAAADALQKAQRVGAAIIETKIRLRVLKMMLARGIEIANEQEIIAWVKKYERKLDVAQEEIIAQQVDAVAAKLGVTEDDEKATRNHRRRIERAQRQANGECIDCPDKQVKRAAPGSTRCHECGQAHNARSRKYRKQRRTQMSDREGANTPAPNGEPSGDSAVATDSTHQAGSGPPVAQSRSREPSGHATASTPGAGPQLPFLTRTKP